LIVLSLTVGLEIALAATNLRLRAHEVYRLSFATTVIRAGKADRLLSRSAVPQNRKIPHKEFRAPHRRSRLTLGCEPAVSTLADTRWSKVAVRCLS
jgi:hypothetical protein